MSSLSRRLGNPVGAFFAIVVLPLVFTGLGIWQHQRTSAEITAYDAKIAETGALIIAIEAGRGPSSEADRTPTPAEARDVLHHLRFEREQVTWHRNLAWVAMTAGAVTILLGPLLMITAFALGQAGRRSQATLICGYRQVRRRLPLMLILLLFAWPAGLAATGYSGLFSGDPVRTWPSAVFLLPFVPASFALLLAVPWGHIVGIPSPGPALVPGRPVSGDEAPGLWRLVTTLAGRLGVAPPDLILVGLTDDLSLVAGPITPEGVKQTLPGNALYVPLPCLAFHQEDEIAALIGYELAHFAGQGAAEALGAIQADIERTMDTHPYGDARRARGSTVGLLIQPALPVGLYVMDQFQQALQSWHHYRVFAADAAAATLVSPAAVARALLRRRTVRRPIRKALKLAWNQHEQARADYFIAFALAHAAQSQLDTPLLRVTKGDPSIHERFLALGQELSDTMIAKARARPDPDAADRLSHYLADPEATVRDATKRFVSRGAPWRPIER